MAVEREPIVKVKSLKAFLSGKNKYLDKLIGDRHLRILVTAAFGGGWNLIYSVYHLILAGCLKSYWFLTMGLYYMIACGMRASALKLSGNVKTKKVEWKALKLNGILMLVLSAVFAGIVCLTITEKRNTSHHVVIAISMATYTFCYVTSGIVNIIKLKKKKSVQMILLRNTSLAYAMGSLFGLERTMLGTFGNPTDGFAIIVETLSGAGVFLLVILLGIKLLRMSSKSEAHEISD